MTRLLATLALLTASALASTVVPTVAIAWYDDQDGKPRNSYERQQETYRQHGYDTRQNGPLDETVAEERRRQAEEERQQQQRQERQQNQDRYGNQCRTLYGC